MRIRLLLWAMLLLAGCAASRQVVTDNKALAGQCKTEEVRPSFFASNVYTKCWGPHGENEGMVGGPGMPTAQAITELGSSAMIGTGVGVAGKFVSNLNTLTIAPPKAP